MGLLLFFEKTYPRDDDRDRYMYDPISLILFTDSVSLGFTGDTFERSIIEEALSERTGKNPLTNMPLESDRLAPNHSMNSTIVSHIKEAGKAFLAEQKTPRAPIAL